MSEIEKEAREYCLNLILNTVLSDVRLVRV
jgi:hypothetical protein